MTTVHTVRTPNETGGQWEYVGPDEELKGPLDTVEVFQLAERAWAEGGGVRWIDETGKAGQITLGG
jgi:hypothetical protein